MKVLTGLEYGIFDELSGLGYYLDKNLAGDQNVRKIAIQQGINRALSEAGLSQVCNKTAGCILSDGVYGNILSKAVSYAEEILKSSVIPIPVIIPEIPTPIITPVTPVPIITPIISLEGYGCIYAGDLHRMSKDALATFYDSTTLQYCLTQVNMNEEDHTEEFEVLRDAVRHGKRIIVQFWFGPDGKYNWSYCGYPQLAMQQESRDYLFSAIDAEIQKLGPEYIYGVHMLEEDAVALGLDISTPGDWRQNRGEIRSGSMEGSTYDVYPALNAKYAEGGLLWNMREPSIAQYSAIMKKELKQQESESVMFMMAERWISRRLWAGAHREFLKFIQGRYPGIKRGVWGGLANSYGIANIAELSDIINFVVTDCYASIWLTQNYIRGLKILAPDAKLFVLTDGMESGVKQSNALLMDIIGVDHGGFFENLDKPSLVESHNALATLSKYPPITNKPKILIVTGNTDNGLSTSIIMCPCYSFVDMIFYKEAYNANLSNYRIIHLHQAYTIDQSSMIRQFGIKAWGVDDAELENWVKAGGILAVTCSWMWDKSSCFIPKNRVFWHESTQVNNYQNTAFKTPQATSFYYNLKPEYRLTCGISETKTGMPNIPLAVGNVTAYGSGIIVNLPIFVQNNSSNSETKAIAEYIADIMREVAKSHDPALMNCIKASDEPFALKYRQSNFQAQIVYDIFNQNRSVDVVY